MSQAIPGDGARLNANVFLSSTCSVDPGPRNLACCMELDSDGLLPRLGGTHCTLGKRLRLARIRGFMEMAGCLGREAGSRLTDWVCPILPLCLPQPLQKPAKRVTALPCGSASLEQAQRMLLQEAWRSAVPNLGDTAGRMAAPRPASAAPANSCQVGPQPANRHSPGCHPLPHRHSHMEFLSSGPFLRAHAHSPVLSDESPPISCPPD